MAERRPRRRGPAGVSIYVLPNLLTTTNMFFGFMSIIFEVSTPSALTPLSPLQFLIS